MGILIIMEDRTMKEEVAITEDMMLEDVTNKKITHYKKTI